MRRESTFRGNNKKGSACSAALESLVGDDWVELEVPPAGRIQTPEIRPIAPQPVGNWPGVTRCRVRGVMMVHLPFALALASYATNVTTRL